MELHNCPIALPYQNIWKLLKNIISGGKTILSHGILVGLLQKKYEYGKLFVKSINTK
jgi:hypothetical protein